MPDQWPYELIEDHAATALSRYTSQYSEADTLHALTTLWAERMQALEDAAWPVLTQRWVPSATAAQLDEMGRIVGEPRLGRTDAAYRDAIRVRVNINRSGGEPERIIEFLTKIAGASQVLYQEIWPAKIEIFVVGDVLADQVRRVRDTVPAGVGTIYITETGVDIPFGTSELGQPLPIDVDGFGELGMHTWVLDTGGVLGFVVDAEAMDGPAMVSEGSLSASVVLTRSTSATYWGVDESLTAGLTDMNDPILPIEGGIIAELFEV